ncbi:protein of unknown function [Flavobacteriaceae bacterium MAR_2010_188]|nr:protein of unknown function [Flavobacteriaceae bacterium MAR_2010_188]
MKRFSTLLILLLIISCAPVRVNYDYESGTDFSSYKTYNYYGELQTGMNELDNKRLMNALNANLQSKGLTISETPDFYIDIKSESYQDFNNGNNVGVGVGGGGRSMGGGVSVGIPLGGSKLNRRLIIDFRDEKGKGLFWQAISESSYNQNASPEQREQDFKAIADKVLSEYPPTK